MFDQVALVKYYDFLNLTQTKIMEYIKIALTTKKYEDMQKFLYSAGQYLKTYQSNLQNEWRQDTFRKLYDHLCQFIKFNTNVKYTN